MSDCCRNIQASSAGNGGTGGGGGVAFHGGSSSAINNDIALDRTGAIDTEVGPYIAPFDMCLRAIGAGTNPNNAVGDWEACVIAKDPVTLAVLWETCLHVDNVSSAFDDTYSDCVPGGSIIELWVKNINKTARQPTMTATFVG